MTSKLAKQVPNTLQSLNAMYEKMFFSFSYSFWFPSTFKFCAGRRHCIGYVCIGVNSTFVSDVFHFSHPDILTLIFTPLYLLDIIHLYRLT